MVQSRVQSPAFALTQLGNELQKQSRDQTQAIKPADWSVQKLDSGLDHGLDYGLEYGLNSRLIFKLVASHDLH